MRACVRNELSSPPPGTVAAHCSKGQSGAGISNLLQALNAERTPIMQRGRERGERLELVKNLWL